MAEGIGGAVGVDVVAIGIDEAFADDHEAEFLAREDAFHIGRELFRAEGHFGQKDDVRRVVRVVAALGERGAGGIQPALRPMTSRTETRSCWPMASLSAAISRTVAETYLMTLP